MVSHCLPLHIEMVHRLLHNLVKCLLVVYLRGRKALWLYQQHHSPSHQVLAGVPHGFCHLSSPLSLTTLCWIARHWSRHDFLHRRVTTSHCWPLLPALWRQRRGWTNSALPWWGGQMGNNCSPEILHYTVHLRYPQVLSPPTRATVWIGYEVTQLNRIPKILRVTMDTHFTFSPHARDCVERALRALNVMKALAGSSWGFTTQTFVATYKAILCLILHYLTPVWFTSSVLFLCGQAWGDTEQGSEDHDWMPSKGHGVPPQSRDRGPPFEGPLWTLFPAVLCQRPSTHAPQSPHRHLSPLTPPLQGRPPDLISPHPYSYRPASQSWWPQLPSSHLWWRAGRGHIFPCQTPHKGWWGWKIGVIVQSLVPNKVLWADPHQMGWSPSWSYRCALSQLHFGHCSCPTATL